MAEIGQDNRCGKCRLGQTHMQGFCCELEVKGETGQEALASSKQERLGSLVPES